MKYTLLRKLTPLLLAVAVTACDGTEQSTTNNNTSTNNQQSQQTDTAPKVQGETIESEDGKSKVVVPKSWSKQQGLNDVADLQIADPSKENYLIVISEPKSDFDNISVEQYSEMTRKFIVDSIQGPQLSEPQNLTINGNPALQYEITGSIDGINIIYFHTAVEGQENFHQVLAWTLPSKRSENEPVLKSIINSFQGN